MELPALVVAFLVIAALIFMPVLRRIILMALRLSIFVAVGAAALAGVTILMNNETIFEKPGAQQRTSRFFTMNSAATSLSGSGAVTCKFDEDPAAMPEPVAASTPATTRSRRRAKKVEAAANQPAAKPPGAERLAQPMGTPAPLDDVFPELIRRGFPGIPRQKLFELSEKTVSALGGWKIVKTDPRTFTLDCIYTTRILRFQDDVRITVEPSGDIDLCSRSGTARPESTSMMRFFPGDLGANIGHIKEFYEVLEPQMDQIYKEDQDKENAKKPR